MDAFTGTVVLGNLAYIHALTGDADSAIREIEQLLSIPSGLSPGLLRVDERWASLRGDPRFRKLAGL